MAKKAQKTEGAEWLGHSLTSFNGSGYADRDSPEDFIASYQAYKTMKGNPEAASMANWHYDFALLVVVLLLDGNGPGRQPSDTNLKKFAKFYPKAINWP